MDKEQKIDKLRTLIRHIEEVQKNAQLLGFKLIDAGEFDLGKRLIANSFLHDQSKFHALEWIHLTKPDDDDDLIGLAIQVHTAHNYHHPECWGGIKDMPQVYLAEMVCDWKARSNELGTDFKEWINDKATRRWKFARKDKVYRDLMKYVDLLIEPSL